MSAAAVSRHPYCSTCGWRKGGVDSWDGTSCKCGHSAPAQQRCTTCDGTGYGIGKHTLCIACMGSGFTP